MERSSRKMGTGECQQSEVCERVLLLAGCGCTSLGRGRRRVGGGGMKAGTGKKVGRLRRRTEGLLGFK